MIHRPRRLRRNAALRALVRGAELELTVDRLAYGGNGVARREDGYVVFVAGAVPGDRVRAVVGKAKRAYAEARAVEIIAASSGRSNASDWKFPQFILSGRFDAGFAVALMTKDVNGFSRLAEELGFDTPVCAEATEYFRRALAAGMGDADHTAIVKLIDKETYP